MTNVLQLLKTAPVDEKSDADVVAFLEAALVDARAGRLTGAVLIAECPDGSSYSVAGIQDRWKVMGYLTWAIAKLARPECD